MNLLNAYIKLKSLPPTFLTRDAAALLNVTEKNASSILARLSKEKATIRLAQGRWSYSASVDPLILPNILTYPMTSYVSLYSALYYHGMIEQIPSTVYAISTTKTKIYHTPPAKISIHHIESTLFTGFEVQSNNTLFLATPEKALFDTLYFSPAKSRYFKKLTELSLPDAFNFQIIENWVQRVKHAGRQGLIRRELEKYRNQ